ncbi:transposase [Candidatus Dependentiae bacterium]|nr:transposase [Candidatus Dependentiae bacterium]
MYQIGNDALSARDDALFYTQRWNIEQFFRTAKQHLRPT